MMSNDVWFVVVELVDQGDGVGGLYHVVRCASKLEAYETGGMMTQQYTAIEMQLPEITICPAHDVGRVLLEGVESVGG